VSPTGPLHFDSHGRTHSVSLWPGRFENSTDVVRRSAGVGPWADPVSFVYGRFTASNPNKELLATSLRR